MEIDFEKIGFDVTKEFTIEDLAKALDCPIDDLVKYLLEEFYIEFPVGVTPEGRQKMPGLKFPKWPSGRYGHWDAEHYFRQSELTPAAIAGKYGLHENMTAEEWQEVRNKVEDDEEIWHVKLHNVDDCFDKVIYGGWESDTLGGIKWNVLHKYQEKWSLIPWVRKLQATRKPWRLYLNRSNLDEEIVVLDAKQFHELMKKIEP